MEKFGCGDSKGTWWLFFQTGFSTKKRKNWFQLKIIYKYKKEFWNRMKPRKIDVQLKWKGHDWNCYRQKPSTGDLKTLPGTNKENW